MKDDLKEWKDKAVERFNKTELSNRQLGLDNDDYFIIGELMVWDEPMTAQEFKNTSNPSQHFKRLERLGFVRKAKWKYTDEYGFCKYYRANKPKLLKAGIIEKSKWGDGYNIQMGTFKHHFELCFDVPTEKGLMSLFKGLDKIRERDYGLWKELIKLISNAMYHSFVKTEKGFLTEEDAWRKRKERMDFAKEEEEELERGYKKNKGKTQLEE